MNNERERDDAALIAEAVETLRELRVAFATGSSTYVKIDALLAKLQPPAEPDRAEVLRDELRAASKLDHKAIINRHFDELRAEIEAERPVIDVPPFAVNWAVAHKSSDIHWEKTTADFILSLTSGTGVRAKPVFSDEVLAAARLWQHNAGDVGILARAILGEK